MMKRTIKILRYDKKRKVQFWQSFFYETANKNVTIATVLRELNKQETLRDITGNQAEYIKWECSCLQQKCGACAMLINNMPALACDLTLYEDSNSNGTIELAPLQKFPVVEDLIVDRRILFDNLKELQVWYNENVNVAEQNIEAVFDASRCLQCGCCMETCISFVPGEEFKGPAAMVPMGRLLFALKEKPDHRIQEAYKKHIYSDCEKFYACHQICPVGIDIARLMAHSEAAIAMVELGKQEHC
jgi:succinate dehydrogenase / fumarate reductase iron-sulfur subunit